MPSVYTAVLYDEDQSARDFILRCARAFGPTVHQREESFDVPPRAPKAFTDYHDRLITSARAELATAEAWTPKEASTLARMQYESDMVAWKEQVEKIEARRARFETMLAQVNAWVPPTDEHQSLKDFMVRQLTEAIDLECTAPTKPRRLTGEQYQVSKIELAQHSINFHERGRQRELDAVEYATSWINPLLASLPDAATV